MTTKEMIRFYNLYRADQQDGYVSDVDMYVKNKLKDSSEEEIQDVTIRLKLRIKQSAIPFTCSQCLHIDTNICNGCIAPYE